MHDYQHNGRHAAMPNARVLKFLLIQTGTYEDAMVRPYTLGLNSNPTAIDMLKESTRNGQIVNPGALSDVAGTLLTQQAMPEGMCHIPNNWNTPRLRFFIEIEYNATNLTRQRQILTGYTDHGDVSSLMGSTVNFDPQMRVYFNNTVTLRDSFMRAVDGSTSYRTTMADDSQILRAGGDTYSNLQGQGYSSGNVHALRPEDLFAGQAASVSVMARGGGQILDTRSSFAMGARKSTRDNTVPSRYLAKCITALGQAYSHTDMENTPPTAVWNSAFATVREQQMTTDLFFGILSNRTQYSQQGYVTYYELCGLLPGLDDQAQYLRPGSMRQTTESYQRGRHEHWAGTGTETLYAARLTSAIPGIMIENMMTKIGFFATNRTVDGKFTIDYHENSVGSFTDGIDLTMFLQRFEMTVILEVLNTLTQNSLIDIEVNMFIDLLGETFISVGVGGAPAVQFTAPTFCDALFAPVMTLNPQYVSDMGEDIGTLVSFIDTPNPQFGMGQGNPGHF
jgi:hypothetical protein